MNRREFLKKAGFAGMLAAAVSAGLTFPKKVWAAGTGRGHAFQSIPSKKYGPRAQM